MTSSIYTTTTLPPALGSPVLCGRPDSAFDPDLIAEVYWQLHTQAPEAWQTERLFDGLSD